MMPLASYGGNAPDGRCPVRVEDGQHSLDRARLELVHREEPQGQDAVKEQASSPGAV
jgi:hypothetical protein